MVRMVWTIWLLLLAFVTPWPQAGSAQTVIKFATLVPEGTPWMNLMEEMNDAIKRQSKGQLSFRFYAGGVAGDERDVIRKMRINQLQGGAFTGFGLGEMLPEVRVLELPFLFRDAAEASHVAGAMFEHFAAALADKGYILLSLDEAGAVHLFSRRPLTSQAEMRGARMWTWQGDPLPLALFKAYGITPLPLSLPDVLPALQSGLIDACYGPPLGVLALQWFTKVSYYSALPMTHVMGAMILSKQQWQKLSPEQQTLVRDTVRKYSARTATTMRRHHRRALELLEQLGLQQVSMSPEEASRLQQSGAQVRQELAGQLYPHALLGRVVQLRDAYRQQHPQGTRTQEAGQ